MPNDLIFCGTHVRPGEKATLALPLPEQYSLSPMYMPINVINGKKKGPCILAFAMIIGSEYNGLEILNQLHDAISPDTLSGSLITVPVLNVYGLTHYPKTTPSGVPIHNSFPGKENGSFNERIAYTFTKEVLQHADYCIELQTGGLNHDIFPQIYCELDNVNTKKLARTFQAPVITEIDTSTSALRQTVEDLNIPLFVYEAGEAMRFDPSAIQIGLEGIQNIMKKLDMIQEGIEQNSSPVFSQDDEWLTSDASGILHPLVSLGGSVKQGDKLGRLSDPFSNEKASYFKSWKDGVIVGINRSPLILEGDSVFKICSFIDNEKAEALLEEWEDLRPETEEKD